jgi:hypothetical protein
VAILTFRHLSFNFATAISKFDSFYYHIVHKRIAKVTDDLVMRRPHGLRSRPSHSSLHRSILRGSMTTPCWLSRHISSVRHFFLRRSRATSRRYTGRRNMLRAPSSSVEVPPTHPNLLPGGLSTPTSTILAPKANAICERVHQILGTMMRTSEIDMANSVELADIDTSIDNTAWALH